MSHFQQDIERYRELGATLYGVSVDPPFAQNTFREENGFEFGMLSDTNKEVIEAYDVVMDLPEMGYFGLAQRAVYVVNSEGVITYNWIADDPHNHPDFEAVAAAVEASI